jgi:putative ABC transport system substrate-binding protein
MIQSITTPMSQACVAAARGTDIPIVFSAVTDPVKGQLVDSWDKPGGNVTGVSDWMDVEAQIALILEVLPKVRKLGVLFNPGEINAQVQVDEMKKAAKKLGLEKVVEASVPTTSDAFAAAKSIVGRVDALWLPTDSTTISAMAAISKICQEYDIPLFGSDVSQVPQGQIAAKGINMYDLGIEAGKVAARVLRGENPANIPIRKAEMTRLWVYPQMAEKMGVKIPKEVLDKATKIITD